MTNNLEANSSKLTRVDIAASEACTRSGIIALLLSVALLLLIPYWIHRPAVVALGHYVESRINLAINVDQLGDDPFWLHYVASHPEAESVPISQLLKVRVDMSSISDVEVGKASPRTPPSAKTSHGHGSNPKPEHLVPPPPTNLSVTVKTEVAEIHSIANSLAELDESDVLTEARHYSNYFNISVLKWSLKRYDLLIQRVNTEGCYKGELVRPYKLHESPYFIPAINNEAILNCFTLHDVRTLAQFQLPQISNPTQLGGDIGQRVELTTGSLPRDPFLASLAAQVILFFVMVYFAAFLSEAALSPDFPVQGTVFGAFSKSQWSLFVFLLALWGPLLASLAVAFYSLNWELMACSVAIFFAVRPAYRALRRKSYFDPLFEALAKKLSLRS